MGFIFISFSVRVLLSAMCRAGNCSVSTAVCLACPDAPPKTVACEDPDHDKIRVEAPGRGEKDDDNVSQTVYF